jgi:hypothetical protein
MHLKVVVIIGCTHVTALPARKQCKLLSALDGRDGFVGFFSGSVWWSTQQRTTIAWHMCTILGTCFNIVGVCIVCVQVRQPAGCVLMQVGRGHMPELP